MNRTERLSVFLLFLVVASLFFVETNLSLAEQAQSRPVDRLIEQWMKDSHTPGLSLAVVKNGKLVEAKGYGFANIETKTPAIPETVYKTASLSKMDIADAILLLVQEGKIRLDDKVSQYLENTPESWHEITLRHLLTHTSGIVRDPSDYQPYTERPLSDVVRSVYPLPLQFAPGDGWLYSNVGYYALAEIITKVSGNPWDQFIAKRLFAPAHMTATRTTTATEIIPNRADGYHWTDHGQTNAEDWIAVRPSGAFLSTVLDLAKWDSFLDHGSPITSGNRTLSWTRATLNHQAPADYGFGWAIDSFLNHSRIHHNGQFPGFRSDYERLDNGKLTVILLANADNAGLDSLALKIAGAYDSAYKTPSFRVRVDAPKRVTADNNPIPISITATDQDISAPNSIVEMEIWDESGKSIYKQHKEDENFTPGSPRTYSFSWTPRKAGKYTVNVGIYGSKWTPSYAWQMNLALITVE